ncbi:MAG: hypothetical protein QM582_08435 [Micropruina sp.]|uniref:hypothetical protein n=1 Tax=Micropruina sp. TaxID=2737536 RepID=UPI0039E3E130
MSPAGAVRRPPTWLIAVLVLALAGGGYLVWRTATDPLPGATVAARRAADALRDRTIADGSFGSTVGPSELADLEATLRGMGSLRPSIAVDSVQLADDQREATARLRAEWVIHDGKPAWVQEAYLRLTRGADGWTGVWQRDLIASGLRPGDRLRAVRLSPVRGEILGRDDERLVWNQEAKRIGLDKALIPADAQPKAAAALAKAVGIDSDGYVAKVAGYGPRAYVEAAVIRAVGPSGWDILDAVRPIQGVRVLDAVRPLARSATFARQLLGSVGEATSDAIRSSGGTVRAGDLVGLAGLQRVHNALLMGTTGFVVQAYPDGNPQDARELFRVPAVDGRSLRTTLDVSLQTRAEKLLARSSGRAAAVLIRPSDGALLAVASKPGQTTATTQRVYPTDFAPVSGLAAPGGPAEAIRLLGLTEAFGLGIETFGAEADGSLRLSPFAMAVATASVARGGTIRPMLVVGQQQPAPASGISPERAETVRQELRKRAGRGALRPLSKLAGPAVLADGDARLWTVAVRGDLVVVGYDSAKGSLDLVRRLLDGQ